MANTGTPANAAALRLLSEARSDVYQIFVCLFVDMSKTMCSFSTATRMEQAYRVEADTFGELQVAGDNFSKRQIRIIYVPS